MYEKDFALNKLQCLMCHKTQPSYYLFKITLININEEKTIIIKQYYKC